MVYLTSFNRMVEKGVCKEPTHSVLPLPVIHTNSFPDTKVLAFHSFLQKNQGPIYSAWIQELLLESNQQKWRIEKTPHKNSFLPFLLSQTLVLEPSWFSLTLSQKSTFSLYGCKGAIFLSLFKEEENQKLGLDLLRERVDLLP